MFDLKRPLRNVADWGIFGKKTELPWKEPLPCPMPAKPSYARRLKPMIAKLQESSALWIGRRDLEELLGVSKTVAWRILRHCHAQKASCGALLFDRLQLITRLEELAAEGGVIAREVARHARVEEQLLAMRSYLHARQTKVVRDELAPALVNTRFENLPANITFTPQSLLVEFYGTEDFLAAVGAIVYALQNDYPAISAFIEKGLKKERT
jgi:hypothetical protein